MNPLQEGIVSALAYYDGFEVPLTSQEVFLALPAFEGRRPSFEDLETALDALVRCGAVAAFQGFYALPGREHHVATRKARYLLAEGKYKKARWFLALARHVPYLRAAFVCNTLARSNARAESDIDIYAVAVPGRIWTARLCVTGLAALLGMRPTAARSADRLCLSFFVAADAADLSGLAIENDVYLAHWLHELYPVYEEDALARRALAANAWMKKLLPETLLQAPSARRALAPGALQAKRAVEGVLDRLLGSRVERWAKRLQFALLPVSLRSAASAPGTGVVLSDSVLKFHAPDRRTEIRDAFRERLRDAVASARAALLRSGFPTEHGTHPVRHARLLRASESLEEKGRNRAGRWAGQAAARRAEAIGQERHASSLA